MSTPPIAWRPDEVFASTNIAAFLKATGLDTYEQLLGLSEDDPEWFWDSFVRFADIRFEQPYRKVLDRSGGIRRPKWFVDGAINLAANALDRQADDPAKRDREALVWEAEDGRQCRFTFADIRREADRVAWFLHEKGIRPGDRVAIYMPMIPETVFAIYGILKSGVVAVPLFSGFGAEAIAHRLVHVGAKAVISTGGYQRDGKLQPLANILRAALERAPDVEIVLLAEHGEPQALSGREYLWNAALPSHGQPFETVALDSEALALVSYTSGTSGAPKGICHVHGGLTVKILEYGCLLLDLKPDDRSFMVTDFGWMVGQLPLFAAHAAGACFVMYEGGLAYPTPHRLFEILERHRITSFGAPATALRLLKAVVPIAPKAHDLSALRILGHVGEPIDEATWQWFFGWGDGRLPLLNASGGTEVFAEIIASTLAEPIKPTSLGRTPAIGARIVDDDGNPVPRGTPGHLVFSVPQPSQTRGFWKAEEEYEGTYFKPGSELWWQGDLVMQDDEGFWFHLGRNDDMVKVSGRRTGPGEIENVICTSTPALTAAVIGTPDPLIGQALVAFVVPQPGAKLAPDEVNTAVVAALGRPYSLRAVHIVAALPMTRTGKVVRRLVKQRYLGEALGDTSSLANPESIDGLPAVPQMEEVA